MGELIKQIEEALDCRVTSTKMAARALEAARARIEADAKRIAELERMLVVCEEAGLAIEEDAVEQRARAEAAEAKLARMRDPETAFERVWAVVRDWDISTEPGEMRLYEGINGDHVRAIVRAALEGEK